MPTATNLCRLCLKLCQERKSLYDEKGQQNVLYEITRIYFHRTIVNLKEAQHLRAICLACWRHIVDFHSFQAAVQVAQLELTFQLHDFGEGDAEMTQEAKAAHEEIHDSEVTNDDLALKIEEEFFAVPTKTNAFADCESDSDSEFEMAGRNGKDSPTKEAKECNNHLAPVSGDLLPLSKMETNNVECVDDSAKKKESLAGFEDTNPMAKESEQATAVGVVENINEVEPSTPKYFDPSTVQGDKPTPANDQFVTVNADSTTVVISDGEEDDNDADSLNKSEFEGIDIASLSDLSAELFQIQDDGTNKAKDQRKDAEEDETEADSFKILELQIVDNGSLSDFSDLFGFMQDDRLNIAKDKSDRVSKVNSPHDAVDYSTEDNISLVSSEGEPHSKLERQLSTIKASEDSNSNKNSMLLSSTDPQSRPKRKLSTKTVLRESNSNLQMCSSKDPPAVPQRHFSTITISEDSNSMNQSELLPSHDPQSMPKRKLSIKTVLKDSHLNNDPPISTSPDPQGRPKRKLSTKTVLKDSNSNNDPQISTSPDPQGKPKRKLSTKTVLKDSNSNNDPQISTFPDPQGRPKRKLSTKTVLKDSNLNNNLLKSSSDPQNRPKRKLSTETVLKDSNSTPQVCSSHDPPAVSQRNFSPITISEDSNSMNLSELLPFQDPQSRPKRKLSIKTILNDSNLYNDPPISTSPDPQDRPKRKLSTKAVLKDSNFNNDPQISSSPGPQETPQPKDFNSKNKLKMSLSHDLKETPKRRRSTLNALKDPNTQNRSQLCASTEPPTNTHNTKIKEPSSDHKENATQNLDDLVAQWIPMIKCVDCDETSSRYSLYRQHFRKEHPYRQFRISCCNRSFRKTHLVREHMLFHRDPNAFKCKFCGRSFASVQNRLKHITHVHPETLDQNFKCTKCAKGFATKKSLAVHNSRKHHSLKKARRVILPGGIGSLYSCEECTYIGNSQANFGSHRKKHTHYLSHERDKCKECGKTFQTLTELLKHAVSHKAHRPYICTVCGVAYLSRNTLLKHKRTKHVTVDVPSLADLKCPLCGECHNSLSLLNSHMVQQHCETFETTQACEGKGDLAVHHFANHKDNNVPSKGQLDDRLQHSCQDCGKGFLTSEALRQHARCCRNESHHKCSICGEFFNFSAELRKHEAAHSPKSGPSTRPTLECNICKKIFKQPQILKRHLAINHTD